MVNGKSLLTNRHWSRGLNDRSAHSHLRNESKLTKSFLICISGPFASVLGFNKANGCIDPPKLRPFSPCRSLDSRCRSKIRLIFPRTPCAKDTRLWKAPKMAFILYQVGCVRKYDLERTLMRGRTLSRAHEAFPVSDFISSHQRVHWRLVLSFYPG